MSGGGWLRVAGLGPGADDLVTPQTSQALREATDVVGYAPYVARVPERAGLARHASDNREEMARAHFALDRAAEGGRVVVVTSGDPGVFAMAAAVMEALEARPDRRDVDIAILPGVSAMLAAAARLGAPLGHDFCAINLSDNLKPWAVVERRIALAVEADFSIALYNPRSRARPDQLGRAFDVARAAASGERLVAFARAVTTPEETLEVRTLAEADPAHADMRTLVFLCNSATRRVGRFLYAPRRHPA